MVYLEKVEKAVMTYGYNQIPESTGKEYDYIAEHIQKVIFQKSIMYSLTLMLLKWFYIVGIPKSKI